MQGDKNTNKMLDAKQTYYKDENINMDLKGIVCENMDWPEVA
jgi:hypothetical protein